LEMWWEIGGQRWAVGVRGLIIAFEVLSQVPFTRLVLTRGERARLFPNDEVRNNSLLLNRSTFGCVIASDRQFQSGTILKLDNRLPRPLPKGRRSHDPPAPGALKGSRHDLRSRRAPGIHQNNHWVWAFCVPISTLLLRSIVAIAT